MIKIYFLLFLLLITTGCSEEHWMELHEDSILNETTDKLNKEELSTPKYDSQEFAESFLNFWRKADYATLYELVSAQELSKEEFVYLSKQYSKAEKIVSVSINLQEQNIVKFEVTTDRYIKRMPAVMEWRDDEWKMRPFYIFDNLGAENVCTIRSDAVTLEECGLTVKNPDKTSCKRETKRDCLFDYAIISKKIEYCNNAEERRTECLQKLGQPINLSQRIEDCYVIPTSSGKSSCLMSLVEETGNPEICRNINFERIKYECYGVVAAKRKDVGLCQHYIVAESFYSPFRNAVCVERYANITQDRSVCDLIVNDNNVMVGALKESCDKIR